MIYFLFLRTSFIVGPIRQFKLMFTPERIMSSLIYLTATTAVILTALRVNLKYFFASINHIYLGKNDAGYGVVLCSNFKFNLVHNIIFTICTRINYKNIRILISIINK